MFEMKAQLRVFEAQETHANYQNTNKQRDLSNKFLNLPLRLITFFSKKTALQGSVHCWTTKWHHKMAQLTWQNPFGELLLLCAAGFISRSGRTRVTWQPWWPGWCVDGFFGGKVLEKIRRSEIFKSESGKILVNSSAFFFGISNIVVDLFSANCKAGWILKKSSHFENPSRCCPMMPN